MDWLDEKLNDYERQKAEKIKSAEEEKKRREEESIKKKRAAAEALIRAHNKFQEVKNTLIEHKYLCELNVALLTDSSTGQKFPNELTLLVKNVPLWGKETISKLNASSLVLTANLGSDDISVITNDERSQGEAPAVTNIKIDMLTDELIDTIIKKFINQIFSN
jgi:hypothetical protein